MSNEDLISRLAQDSDKSEEEVEELVDEELEELKQHQTAEMDEETLRGHAIQIVKNDLMNITGGGFGGGETKQFSLLTLGFQYRDGEYFVTDGNAIVGSGIINPPEAPAGFSTFVIDEAHGVDLEHAAEAFMPLNTVRGKGAFRRVGSRDGEPAIKKGGKPTYSSNSTEDSVFEMVDPDDVPEDDPISQLPSDQEAKRELIHNNFITDEEVVTIQNYADHVTATRTAQNGNEYEIAFGVDVKRMRGEVVDAVRFESGDGAMTLTDETVYNEEDVPQELIGDKQRTPGLQVQIAGDLVYGENSVLDAYGYIQQTQDGQYQMQGLGIIPIVEFDYEGPEVGGSSSSDDDAVEEDTI